MLWQAWNNISPTSPNITLNDSKIVLFNMGGLSISYPNETIYDWKHRLSMRMSEEALVGLLYQAAQPPRRPAVIDERRDSKFIHWTQIPVPRLVGRIFVCIIIIYLIYVIVNLFGYLTAGKWLFPGW
jgi:hypothetical protein